LDEKIQPEGTVKVLDFELAKTAAALAVHCGEATQTQTLTVAGTVMGAPSYMAPEQARGKPADKRADIWAFGGVLYEMLSGRRPFTADSTPDILAAVLTSEPNLKGYAVLVASLDQAASARPRNRLTCARNAPAGSRSPRSHRANVPASTPTCFADFLCENPKAVRH
jgi:serine/threonine protein kinase